jgi:hypothetical protein
LLFLIGMAGYWWLYLRFTVVSRQQFPEDAGILFSAWNIGYPALLGEKTVATGSETVHWLDEECLPQSENVGPYYIGSMFRVSPHRKTIARLNNPSTILSEVTLVPSGAKRPRTITHRKTHYNAVRWVADDGSFCTGDERLFDAQGRRVPIPQGFRPTRFLCADSRYLALESNFLGWSTRPHRDRLLVYDSTEKRFVATPLYMWRHHRGMVYHSGDRFLAVPENGEAIVFTADKVLGHFGTPSTQWRWGEDGSAWANINKTPKILIWRKGTCRLIPFPRVPAIDPGACGMTSTGRETLPLAWNSSPGVLAVWGDGQYTAISETVPLTPLQKKILLQWIRHFPRTLTMNYRRVTLYRNGHRVGSSRLPLQTGVMTYRKGPSPPSAMASPGRRPLPGYFLTKGGSAFMEHLAFTADGKHLAWLLRDGDTLRITVFAVP